MGPTLVDFYRIGFGLWGMAVIAPYVAAAAVVAVPAIVVAAALSGPASGRGW